MDNSNKIFIGKSSQAEYFELKYANRHGLIAGATGTGKTVSLQILAEGFSNAGVPVFCTDVKGDLSGISQPSNGEDFLTKRASKIGLDNYKFEEFPTIFWDLFAEKDRQGHPVRTTITEMGPLMLSRLLNLNETQEGVMNIAFKIADEEGLALLDLKDIRAILIEVGNRTKEISLEYGNISTASVGAIQRKLLVLEEQGGEYFFGEPALNINDLMQTAPDGRGYISILAADQLMRSPDLYATFLLWLISELFEELPEIGDPEKPRLVFFFDEAHLLFNEAPKSLLDKIEQMVKLIRSKGVGIYFVTQNPLDIPDTILAQLGNRIQHALRAYTPREIRAVKAAANTFRPNPEFNAFDTIKELGVGEALVSSLEQKGVPSIVQRTLIRPPSSRLGSVNVRERRITIKESPVYGIYDETIDRESASELLEARAITRIKEEKAIHLKEEKEKERKKKEHYEYSRKSRSDSIGTAIAKSVARSISTQIGRAIIRGILGTIKKNF